FPVGAQRPEQGRAFFHGRGNITVGYAQRAQEGAQYVRRLDGRTATAEVSEQLAVREARSNSVGGVDGKGGLAHAGTSGDQGDPHAIVAGPDCQSQRWPLVTSPDEVREGGGPLWRLGRCAAVDRGRADEVAVTGEDAVVQADQDRMSCEEGRGGG